MPTTDLVLINPASRRKVYQSLGDQLAAIEPPVWAGLMATFVRRMGYSVQVIDAEASEISNDQAARQAVDTNPTLIAVPVYGHQPSASTQIMPAAAGVCSAVKRIAPEQKVLLLGGHVATLPQRTLDEEQADFVSGGEGLYTLVDLIVACRVSDPDLTKVRDLWYRDGDEPRFTTAAPLVLDLDNQMPDMAWDLMPMSRYRAHNWHCLGGYDRQPYAAVYTTLGCPYKCSFCCIQAPFKSGEAALGQRASANSYRFWSPQNIVDQLEMLAREYSVKNIKVADEMFVLNRNHVESICDLIIERKLDLNIWAYARVDTVKDGMLEKLKAAGFNWLALGIEAASEKVRGNVQKGYHQELIFKTIEKIADSGIYVIGNYIFGLPEDDMATMQETLDLAMELNCEFANFYCAMAYPGSQLYEDAVANSWKLPESWNGYSQHAVDTLPLPTKHLDAGDVLRFRDHAFQAYFTNPNYLQKIKKTFGQETVDHILSMSSHKLERRVAG